MPSVTSSAATTEGFTALCAAFSGTTAAISVEGAFDVMIPAGETRRVEVKKTGSFPYTCRFHPNMKGELHVL